MGVDRQFLCSFKHRKLDKIATVTEYSLGYPNILHEDSGAVTIINTMNIIRSENPLCFVHRGGDYLLQYGNQMITNSEYMNLDKLRIHSLSLFNGFDRNQEGPVVGAPIQAIARLRGMDEYEPLLAMRWPDGTVRIQSSEHSLHQVFCTGAEYMELNENVLEIK